ncbi:MAG: hypothetical protein FWD25_05740 [Clostridia bacterium]|nr:hypothetical protein [Clostridia bacterium]
MPASDHGDFCGSTADRAARPAMESAKALDLLAGRGDKPRINPLLADKMEWWERVGELVRRWRILAIVFIGCFLGCTLAPVARWEAPAQTRLLDAATACQVQAHAFYIEASATLPRSQAQAVMRLAEQAVREWPVGEATSIPVGELERVTLAATCPPDASRAQAIERRMRMLLGYGARVSICLTGRINDHDLAAVAERALLALDDSPHQALREAGLVSLTGERAQVALRKDEAGAMAFFGFPFVMMDY